jgi:hypothetical protein
MKNWTSGLVDPDSITYEIEEIIESDDDSDMMAQKQRWTIDTELAESSDPFDNTATLPAQEDTGDKSAPKQHAAEEQTAPNSSDPSSTVSFQQTKPLLFQKVWDMKRGPHASTNLNPNAAEWPANQQEKRSTSSSVASTLTTVPNTSDSDSRTMPPPPTVLHPPPLTQYYPPPSFPPLPTTHRPYSVGNWCQYGGDAN